jgi:hypothetical protein
MKTHPSKQLIQFTTCIGQKVIINVVITIDEENASVKIQHHLSWKIQQALSREYPQIDNGHLQSLTADIIVNMGHSMLSP